MKSSRRPVVVWAGRKVSKAAVEEACVCSFLRQGSAGSAESAGVPQTLEPDPVSTGVGSRDLLVGVYQMAPIPRVAPQSR